MGADFIFSAARLPRCVDSKGGKVIFTDHESLMAAIHDEAYARVLNLDESLLNELGEMRGVADDLTDDEVENIWDVKVAEQVMKDLEEILQAVDKGWRDVATAVFDDPAVWWVLSGDMSWGDGTESMDPIYSVGLSGITDEPFVVRA